MTDGERCVSEHLISVSMFTDDESTEKAGVWHVLSLNGGCC